MKTKFRVWDRKLETMYQPNELIIQIKDSEILVAHDPTLHQFIDYSLTQSTGLYDKYHNEVFVGDILCDDHDYEYGVVIIEEAQALVDWGSHTFPLFEDVDTLEVIGNIYENPELLEGKWRDDDFQTRT